MTQSDAQALNYKIAIDWYADGDIDLDGVSLGDIMRYDGLRVAGNILKEWMEGDGRSPDQS